MSSPRRLALLLTLAASPLGAQSSAAGTIAGTVFDSLVTRRPLADAEVWIDGSNLTTRTDAEGRFRLTGVPLGAHRVTFYHPSLEALRLGAPVRGVTLAAATPAATVQLVTPSAATVYRAFCAASGDVKTGVLLGRVRAGASPAPAPNAEVALSWNLWTLARAGLANTPREVGTRTAPDGTFFVCGVPTDVPVQLRVQLPDGGVAVEEVSLRDEPVGVALLDVPAVAAGAAVAPGTATVAGVLRTSTGRGVAGALVEVLGTAIRATTDSAGAFALRGIAPGTQTVEARTLGFRPVRARLLLEPGRARAVALTLGNDVVVLAPTRVVAPRVAAMLDGYERRRRAGLGDYITAEQIAQRNPYSVHDVFVGLPGIQVVLPPGDRPGASPRIIFNRNLGLGAQGTGTATAGSDAPMAIGQSAITPNGCDPVTFVDGVRFNYDNAIGGLDALLRPQDIHGIEVYRNLAAAPAQYQQMGSSCGLILVWTKRGR